MHYAYKRNILVVLSQGVGPATASALMSCYDENIPFMSDEILAAFNIKSKTSNKYSNAAFDILLDECQEVVRLLNLSEKSNNKNNVEENSSSLRIWNCRLVEKCIWSEAIQHLLEEHKSLKNKTKKKKSSSTSTTGKKRTSNGENKKVVKKSKII